MVSFCKIFQENQNFESWSPSLKLEYSHMLHVGLDVGLDFTYVFGKLLFTTVVGVNVQGSIPDTYLKSPDVLYLFTTQIYTDIPYLFYHNLNLQRCITQLYINQLILSKMKITLLNVVVVQLCRIVRTTCRAQSWLLRILLTVDIHNWE